MDMKGDMRTRLAMGIVLLMIVGALLFFGQARECLAKLEAAAQQPAGIASAALERSEVGRMDDDAGLAFMHRAAGVSLGEYISRTGGY